MDLVIDYKMLLAFLRIKIVFKKNISIPNRYY